MSARPGSPEAVATPAAVPVGGGSERVALELVGLTKVFETRRTRTVAVEGIDLQVREREVVSLIGRSGCGKTTILRALAGLVTTTAGEVRVQGRPLWTRGARDSEVLSACGVVFQEAHLFPWFTVEENVALPLRLRGVRRADRLARAHELTELLGLGGFERSYPRELSGGMRQRAAIARALSYRPGILLMDEPFGALDALTRERMNLELQSVAAATGATVVFVTHDITEAVFVADRVVVLSPRPGRIRSVTDVPFPRPRDLDVESRPEFQDLVRTLRHQLNEEDT